MRVSLAASKRLSTRISRVTLNAKNTPLSSTPTPTPIDRSCVTTVTATVASMTAPETLGWRARSASEPQENVLIETMPGEKKTESVKSLLNGPVVNPEGRTDVVASQKQVDDLLDSLGF